MTKTEALTEEEKKRKKSEQARRAAKAPRRMTEKARKQRSEAGKKHGAMLSEQVAEAKALLKREAEKNHKPAYVRADLMACRIASYIVNARRQEKPLTETGLIVALGVTEKVYKAYANGERDHLQQIGAEARENNIDIDIEIDKTLLDADIKAVFDYLMQDDNAEYNVITAPYFSVLLQKARLLVTLEREERLAKSGRVGDIFTMKAREHWQDGTEHKTNVLQITTRNATEALQLLGFKQEGKD